MTRILVWVASGFAAGLCLAYAPARSWEMILLMLAALGVVLIKEVGTHAFFLRVVLLLTAALFGLMYMSVVEESNQSDLTRILSQSGAVSASDQFAVETEGVLVTPVEVDGDQVRFDFSLRQVQWQGRVYSVREKVPVSLRVQTLQEKSQASGWGPGVQLRLPLTLQLPSAADNPGAFDYGKYLHEQQMHWQASGRSLNRVEVLPAARSWSAGLYAVTKDLGKRLDLMYGPEVAGLMQGMILGVRDAVGYQVEENFSLLGIIHILAISGLHVGIVAALIAGLLQAVGLNRDQALLVAVLLLPFYAVLTGFNPPVVRAVIMTLVAFGALKEKRVYDGPTAISLAALLMLAWDPYLLFQVSFQLSFVVTLGLLLAAGGLAEYFCFLPGVLAKPAVRNTLAITVVAQAVSFPLLITYFHQFSFLSWVANLLFIPFFSAVVIPLGFLSLLLGLIHPGLAFLTAGFNEGLVRMLLRGVEEMAQWTWFSTIWPTPSLRWTVVYYLLLALGYRRLVQTRPTTYFRFLPGKGRLRGLMKREVVLGVVAIAWTLWVWLAYLPHAAWERGVRVTFLDVGQGDAAIVETPKEVWMIDAGGRLPWGETKPWQLQEDAFDVGEDVVIPYLQHRGIRRVDVLVMTHGDADHIQGFEAVVEQVKVSVAMVNGREPGNLQQEILDKLIAEGVPVYRAEAGRAWQTASGVVWHVLHPPMGEGAEEDGNDASIALLLSAYGREVLFTGDLEEQGEIQMANSRSLAPVEVLKVGHHGSRTSTTGSLLEAVEPVVGVISVGANNTYGHPAPEVLHRLAEHDVAVLRTDRNGAVTVRILPDGRWGVSVMKEPEPGRP